MNRPIMLWLLSVILIFIFTGCSNRDNPIKSYGKSQEWEAYSTGIYIPPGAEYESASIILNVALKSSQTVRIHRITSEWSESEVTWNSFAASYDPDPSTLFVPDALGDVEIDITNLVQDWLDGIHGNYGVVLCQSLGMSQYHSSEHTDPNFHPRLIIRFLAGGESDSIVIQEGLMGEVEDAFIGANFANGNNGEATRLFAGIAFGFEHQALIKFEMDQPPSYSALGDFVWNDLNMNGIQDANENGLPNITVNLLDNSNNLIASIMTDINGLYMFEDIYEGEYIIEFEIPREYTFSPKNSGPDNTGDSDADPQTGRTDMIILEPGYLDMSRDAGMYMTMDMGEGCTHGIGHWRNHAGFGHQADMVSDLLPIILGLQGGAKSIAVSDNRIAADILRMKAYGQPSNGITKLYAHLLAAKLNIVGGANGEDIDNIIDEVDTFLAENNWNDWRMISPEERKMVLGWKDLIEDYNQGRTGPGNCDRAHGEGINDNHDTDILEAGR